MKIDNTLFSGHAQHVLAKWHLWASKLSKSSHSPNIFSKTGKRSTFHKNCTKFSFQVMRGTFWPYRICERHSSQDRHTCLKFSPKRQKRRFSWKLYKTLFSGHEQQVLAKSHFRASKLSKSSHSPQILSKQGKQCAFHENCTKSSFQVMRSTFWPNCIFEGQSCQNRHTGLKFSSKRENSALSMKIVQNAFFQVMRSTFWPNRIFEGQTSENRYTGLKFSSKGKNCALFIKIVQTFFSGHAQHVLAKSHFWASQFSKASHWRQIHSKKENSALFMKIVQNVFFRSCGARFGQIAFVSVKVVIIVTLAANSLQKEKTVRFPWKLYKTLFSGHAEHVFAESHFSVSKLSKSHWSQIHSKQGKPSAFYENCTKRSFQVMRSKFWPNSICERQSFQNRHTCLKFCSKGKNCALFIKIVQTFLSGHAQHVLAKSHFWASKLSRASHWPQILFKTGKQCAFHENWQNALFRSCAARFGQIGFLSVKSPKIVTLATNSLQKGKTVRISWKLYKTLFSGHAENVLAESHLLASKLSWSSHWP